MVRQKSCNVCGLRSDVEWRMVMTVCDEMDGDGKDCFFPFLCDSRSYCADEQRKLDTLAQNAKVNELATIQEVENLLNDITGTFHAFSFYLYFFIFSFAFPEFVL
jgi:hypothetical protein